MSDGEPDSSPNQTQPALSGQAASGSHSIVMHGPPELRRTSVPSFACSGVMMAMLSWG